MNLHTLLRGKTALAMALCAAACSQFSSAQVAPPVILQIDLTNNVLYFQDTSDISKYATEPNVTPPTASLRNFYRVEGIADIVAVNGQPMKGTYANAAARADRASFRWGSPAATTMVHRVVGKWDDPGDVCMVRSFIS